LGVAVGRVAIGFAVVGACAPAAPVAPAIDNTARPPAPVSVQGWHYPTTWRVARPDVDLSALSLDLGDELRWPLSPATHPVLEPTFAIARALAAPGVSWIDLCGRGVEHRHLSRANDRDLVEYLGAWCHVVRHEPTAALSRLALLDHSVVLGLPAALPHDIANIVADHFGADEAELQLGKAAIHDVAVLDLLAATYVEIGRVDDAAEINTRAIENDAYAPEAVTCHRWAREIALATVGARAGLIERFHAREDRTPNPICHELLDRLDCWANPATGCAGYVADQGLDPQYVSLATAYYGWPEGDAGWELWQAVAEAAVRAFPLAGAEALAESALVAARKTSACTRDRLEHLHNLALVLPDPWQATFVANVRPERCADANSTP
jgi:hypothetical protein